MPYILLIVGVVLFLAALRGTHKELGNLLVEDIFDRQFMAWLTIIFGLGFAGYIKELRPLSIAFMSLVLIVYIISQRGVFQQLLGQWQTITVQNRSTDTQREESQLETFDQIINDLQNSVPSLRGTIP
jgi:hypothetical protein